MTALEDAFSDPEELARYRSLVPDVAKVAAGPEPLGTDQTPCLERDVRTFLAATTAALLAVTAGVRPRFDFDPATISDSVRIKPDGTVSVSGNGRKKLIPAVAEFYEGQGFECTVTVGGTLEIRARAAA